MKPTIYRGKILLRIIKNINSDRKTYLADSGITKGVKIAKMHGVDVTIANIFQSAKYKAMNGKAVAAAVKKIAIDIFATNVLHFGPTYSKTNMYIIVKQLSNANPTKNRHKENCQKFETNIVATPAIKPIKLHPTNEGTLPNLSAIHPNKRPPTIAPRKNIDWASVGRVDFSQTHSSLK